MSDDIQSIEDLIVSGQDEGGDETTPTGKFAAKEKQIKRKQLEGLVKQTAGSLGLGYVNLTGFPISPEALSLIPEEEAARIKAICFFFDGATLRMATTEPDSAEAKETLKRLAEQNFAKGSLYLISEQSLKHALSFYAKLPKPYEVVRGVKIEEAELAKYSDQFSGFKALQLEVEKAEVSEVVTIMLAAAIKAEASDIHIEAEEKGIKVRYRVDGVLHDVLDLDKNLWHKIISRLKLLSEVKINVTDKPQDGRFAIFLKDDRIDIRVSFLPTAFGESVVMRLLHSKSVGLSFEELGIRQSDFEKLKREVERPNGMVITTGPTGSGKTTTLYAILKKLNNEDTKIITVEDPIEYQLTGVNQSQVSEKYTFAQGLRSIVRQDPDVIMVGEVRDLETAEIAIQAALTGHLVLSTIHTNDAAGTVPRLLSMGAKPFLIAPAINAMIGQRLVRKICQQCKTEDKPSAETVEKAKKLLKDLPEEDLKGVDINKLKFYKGGGCPACQQIGYKGRIGIYEIMTMNKDLEQLILSGNVSEYDMRDNAAKHGMITMAQDGVLKASAGITSLDEVFRVAE